MELAPIFAYSCWYLKKMLLVLSLALVLHIIALKQKFNEHSSIELINGKSQTNRDQKSDLLFYSDRINIEEFDSNLLKMDKKSYKDIYYIGHITNKKIGNYENIYSVNPLYLIIGEVIGHIEQNNGNKYLVFDSTDESKEVLKNAQNFGMGSRMKLKQ